MWPCKRRRIDIFTIGRDLMPFSYLRPPDPSLKSVTEGPYGETIEVFFDGRVKTTRADGRGMISGPYVWSPIFFIDVPSQTPSDPSFRAATV